MFHCEVCGTLVSAKTPVHRIILKTRARIYPARAEIHLKVAAPSPSSKAKPRRRKANKPRKPEWKNDPGGRGFEIVREVWACSSCAEKHKAA